VPTPGGVQLRWYAPQNINSSNPIPIASNPINIIGIGSTYDAYLAVSETNFLGTITALAPTAGCTGAVTATALTAPPGNLPTAAPYTVLTYYDIDATAVVASGSVCTLSFQDNYVPSSGPTPAPVTINVIVTSGSNGSFQ
jgi:hypothetical protein